MRLLLLSNSTNHGQGYLDHAASEVTAFFSGIDRLLFVPYAIHDQHGYWATARRRFNAIGIELDRLEEGPEGLRALQRADGVFVGGGNTFRLLDRLQRSRALEPLRERARGGMPYMGSSAGTVIAAPTLKTTNDMPIVEPRSFGALDLVPFQINCHYLDPDPASRHMGETREQRIVEFLEENDVPVLGLREGAILRVDGAANRVSLAGTAGARLFSRGAEPREFAPGGSLDHLLARP